MSGGEALRTGIACALLLAACGCRTPQPNLKPPMPVEALNTPPSETRYNTSAYPKQAFATVDPTKSAAVGGPGAGGMMPPRPGSMGGAGSMGAPGGNGMSNAGMGGSGMGGPGLGR